MSIENRTNSVRVFKPETKTLASLFNTLRLEMSKVKDQAKMERSSWKPTPNFYYAIVTPSSQPARLLIEWRVVDAGKEPRINHRFQHFTGLTRKEFRLGELRAFAL